MISYKRGLMALFLCMVRHGTVQYDSLLGGFPLLSVPGTWYFLVPPPTRFKAIHTFTKTWCVNSTDHWLAGENRHYCVTELTTRDLTDLNQHSQRRIGCNFCLNKHTFLYQPKNVCFVVCWGNTDVLLERIQRELDGATRNENALCIYFLHFVYF